MFTPCIPKKRRFAPCLSGGLEGTVYFLTKLSLLPKLSPDGFVPRWFGGAAIESREDRLAAGYYRRTYRRFNDRV
jgi:hypothetical protein